MRWALAILISLFILLQVSLRPIWLHQGYQVQSKKDACLRVIATVKELGYKLLLSSSEGHLVEECSSPEIVYCLIIPGTNPLKFLAVGGG